MPYIVDGPTTVGDTGQQNLVKGHVTHGAAAGNTGDSSILNFNARITGTTQNTAQNFVTDTLGQLVYCNATGPPSTLTALNIGAAGTFLTVSGGIPAWGPLTAGPVNYGKTIFVDSVNGNDGTGTRGRFDLPFLTIAAAMVATGIVSSDLIYVRPGTYTPTATILMSINYYFEAGAIVNYNDTVSTTALFHAPGGTGPFTCNVDGYGEFNAPLAGAVNNYIVLINDTTTLRMRCKSMTATTLSAIRCGGAAHTVNIEVHDNITCLTQTGAGVYLSPIGAAASAYLKCNNIAYQYSTGGFAGLHCQGQNVVADLASSITAFSSTTTGGIGLRMDGSTGGPFYVNCNSIIVSSNSATSTTDYGVVLGQALGAQARSHLWCHEITATSRCIRINPDGATFQFHGDVLRTTSTDAAVQAIAIEFVSTSDLCKMYGFFNTHIKHAGGAIDPLTFSNPNGGSNSIFEVVAAGDVFGVTTNSGTVKFGAANVTGAITATIGATLDLACHHISGAVNLSATKSTVMSTGNLSGTVTFNGIAGTRNIVHCEDVVSVVVNTTGTAYVGLKCRNITTSFNPTQAASNMGDFTIEFDQILTSASLLYMTFNSPSSKGSFRGKYISVSGIAIEGTLGSFGGGAAGTVDQYELRWEVDNVLIAGVDTPASPLGEFRFILQVGRYDFWMSNLDANAINFTDANSLPYVGSDGRTGVTFGPIVGVDPPPPGPAPALYLAQMIFSVVRCARLERTYAGDIIPTWAATLGPPALFYQRAGFTLGLTNPATQMIWNFGRLQVNDFLILLSRGHVIFTITEELVMSRANTPPPSTDGSRFMIQGCDIPYSGPVIFGDQVPLVRFQCPLVRHTIEMTVGPGGNTVTWMGLGCLLTDTRPITYPPIATPGLPLIAETNAPQGRHNSGFLDFVVDRWVCDNIFYIYCGNKVASLLNIAANEQGDYPFPRVKVRGNYWRTMLMFSVQETCQLIYEVDETRFVPPLIPVLDAKTSDQDTATGGVTATGADWIVEFAGGNGSLAQIVDYPVGQLVFQGNFIAKNCIFVNENGMDGNAVPRTPGFSSCDTVLFFNWDAAGPPYSLAFNIALSDCILITKDAQGGVAPAGSPVNNSVGLMPSALGPPVNEASFICLGCSSDKPLSQLPAANAPNPIWQQYSPLGPTGSVQEPGNMVAALGFIGAVGAITYNQFNWV